MQKHTYKAPALARGIKILQILESGEPLSLHAIATHSGMPKSSALRIVRDLTTLRLIRKSPEDGTYSAIMRLVPVSSASTDINNHLNQLLPSLAVSLDLTIEWYVAQAQGLVLIRQEQPAAAVVRLKAQEGFIRRWGTELEAVATIGHAFEKIDHIGNSQFWTYNQHGKKVAIPHIDAIQHIAKAKSNRYCGDMIYNSNGIRRMAVPVLKGEFLVGILAVAQPFTPGADRFVDTIRKSLCESALKMEQLVRLKDHNPQ